jgi:uncharacterized protein YdhG (YjbR/CyaY superfamily)
MDGKFKTTEEYMASINEQQRTALKKLQAIIVATAPTAEATISYQMPAFKQNGLLVCYAAFKNHYSLFPCSAATVAQFEEELKEYTTSKGTIQFEYNKPLPTKLIKKIVSERLK